MGAVGDAVGIWAGIVARFVLSVDFGPIGPIVKDRTGPNWEESAVQGTRGRPRH